MEKGMIYQLYDLNTKSGKRIYKIFVAGIPLPVSTREIGLYFKSYGGFKVDMEEFKSRINSGKNKGYLVLWTDNKDEFNFVLNTRYFDFRDRVLTVKHFKYGAELNRDNQDLNSRRIIIKKVPHIFSEMEILNLIQSRFGPIESIYQFKRFHKGRRRKSNLGKFRSYSIVLTIPEMAQIMASQGILYLPNGQYAEIF